MSGKISFQFVQNLIFAVHGKELVNEHTYDVRLTLSFFKVAK